MNYSKFSTENKPLNSKKRKLNYGWKIYKTKRWKLDLVGINRLARIDIEN